MNKNENLTVLIDKAIAGDRDSLETVILSVRDLIFNLSAYFSFSRLYESPEQIKRFLTEFLESPPVHCKNA